MVMPDAFRQSTPSAAAGLSDVLLEVTRRASAAGMYETAYHALAGAMHAAEDGADLQRLAVIREEALRQQDIVDAASPDHRLSRKGGEQGHRGWLETLAMLASAASVRMRGAEAVEHAEQLRDRRPFDAGRSS